MVKGWFKDAKEAQSNIFIVISVMTIVQINYTIFFFHNNSYTLITNTLNYITEKIHNRSENEFIFKCWVKGDQLGLKTFHLPSRGFFSSELWNNTVLSSLYNSQNLLGIKTAQSKHFLSLARLTLQVASQQHLLLHCVPWSYFWSHLSGKKYIILTDDCYKMIHSNKVFRRVLGQCAVNNPLQCSFVWKKPLSLIIQCQCSNLTHSFSVHSPKQIWLVCSVNTFI